MRAEKKYLIDEVETHLKKSDYVILANFTGVTVADAADLRQKLAAEKAEYHVVKNSSLRVAAKSLGVAKILKQFFKDKQKVEVKAGVLSKKLISPNDVARLADMPSLDTLRAQLLGLVNQPAGMFVRIINAVPQGLVNVLQAKVRAGQS